jgi:hypothetical protein
MWQYYPVTQKIVRINLEIPVPCAYKSMLEPVTTDQQEETRPHIRVASLLNRMGTKRLCKFVVNLQLTFLLSGVTLQADHSGRAV